MGSYQKVNPIVTISTDVVESIGSSAKPLFSGGFRVGTYIPCYRNSLDHSHLSA